MTWTMRQERHEAPRRFLFFIGDLQVAEIRFKDGQVILFTMSAREEFGTMGLAMKAMHRQLNNVTITEDQQT
jgi:hypothetical protein